MKKLKIVFPANASYEEVTDSIRDLFKGIIIVEQQLGDGFQFKDLFEGGIKLTPIVQEVVNDVPVFWEEFKKLTPEAAMKSIVDARNMIIASGETFGKVSTYVARFLFVSASGFDSAMIVKQQGDRTVSLWKKFVGGEEVFPV